ncbi:MAG: hypothetical protein ACH350_06835 [Parachlamydiaceae bacterium]
MTIPDIHSICCFSVYGIEKLGEQLGKLNDKIVVLNQSWAGAYGFLIVSTVISFEIALVICRLANAIFRKNPKDSTPQSLLRLSAFSSLFICSTGISVYVFCKKMQSPLDLWRVISVSFTTGFLYLCYRESVFK